MINDSRGSIFNNNCDFKVYEKELIVEIRQRINQEDGTKIESVANRVLLFDSSRPHSSTRCTDQKVRVNINLNYYTK